MYIIYIYIYMYTCANTYKLELFHLGIYKSIKYTFTFIDIYSYIYSCWGSHSQTCWYRKESDAPWYTHRRDDGNISLLRRDGDRSDRWTTLCNKRGTCSEILWEKNLCAASPALPPIILYHIILYYIYIYSCVYILTCFHKLSGLTIPVVMISEPLICGK